MTKMFIYYVAMILLISTKPSLAEVSRISDKEFDLSKPQIVYMTPGRSTVVDFPCEISHSILGLTHDVKVRIGPDSKTTMTLWISSEQSQPTNLTVKCDDEIYVFDIYPNNFNHQDYVKIVDSFDGRTKAKRALVSSSSRDLRKNEKDDKKLIAQSKTLKNVSNNFDSQILGRLNVKKKTKKLLSKGVSK